MARQKLPQHVDDCIKCEIPTPSGLYHGCMNCRIVAVKENMRL